uniref:Uncharacterized protein n=1 Tax=Oryza meridionalis TaxID=40149 RepID=A0A0E0EIM5_9ORYZ
MSVRLAGRVGGARVAPAPAPAGKTRDGGAITTWNAKDRAAAAAAAGSPSSRQAMRAAAAEEDDRRGRRKREEESLRAFMFISFWGPNS